MADEQRILCQEMLSKEMPGKEMLTGLEPLAVDRRL